MTKETTNPINLQRAFGRYYEVIPDPTYDDSRTVLCHPDDILIIPCQYGEIGPQGGPMLWVEVAGRHSETMNRLESSGVCSLVRQRTDGQSKYHFHVDAFDLVASVVNPKLRPGKSHAEPRCVDLVSRYGKQYPIRTINRDDPWAAYITTPQGAIRAIGGETMRLVHTCRDLQETERLIKALRKIDGVHVHELYAAFDAFFPARLIRHVIRAIDRILSVYVPVTEAQREARRQNAQKATAARLAKRRSVC